METNPEIIENWYWPITSLILGNRTQFSQGDNTQ